MSSGGHICQSHLRLSPRQRYGENGKARWGKEMEHSPHGGGAVQRDELALFSLMRKVAAHSGPHPYIFIIRSAPGLSGYSGAQDRQGPCLHGARVLEGRQTRTWERELLSGPLN